MVKLQFNSSNKKDTGGDFPALKLAYGEKARILCIETEPEVGFIHNLRAPAILADGTPVMEEVKNRSGDMVSRQKMDFLGRHLCFGNIETLLDTGKDPQGCPTCAKSVEHADMIDPPQRRFAMHVVRYKVVPGSFKVQTPFQAELLVWSFTDKKFSTIADIAEEHGDLRQKDLLLGPCTSEGFQNFEIQVAGSAAWLESAEAQEFVKVLYASNRIPDLTVALGRKIEKSMAAEDVQKVLNRYAQVRGTAMMADATAQSGAATGGTDLDALLSGTETAPSPTPQPVDAPSLPDFATANAEPPAAPQPQATPEPASESEKPKVLDFDALLSGIE